MSLASVNYLILCQVNIIHSILLARYLMKNCETTKTIGNALET